MYTECTIAQCFLSIYNDAARDQDLGCCGTHSSERHAQNAVKTNARGRDTMSVYSIEDVIRRIYCYIYIPCPYMPDKDDETYTRGISNKNEDANPTAA